MSRNLVTQLVSIVTLRITIIWNCNGQINAVSTVCDIYSILDTVSYVCVCRQDPDAPTRQKKRLCDLDEEDDDKLLHYIFCCVRAGQITEVNIRQIHLFKKFQVSIFLEFFLSVFYCFDILDLNRLTMVFASCLSFFLKFQASKVCKKIGQPWRAVTLDGWRLFHDPNMEELGPGGLVQRVEGNQYRDLWKYTCWKISEDVISKLLLFFSNSISFLTQPNWNSNRLRFVVVRRKWTQNHFRRHPA